MINFRGWLTGDIVRSYVFLLDTFAGGVMGVVWEFVFPMIEGSGQIYVWISSFIVDIIGTIFLFFSSYKAAEYFRNYCEKEVAKAKNFGILYRRGFQLLIQSGFSLSCGVLHSTNFYNLWNTLSYFFLVQQNVVKTI